VFKDRVTRNLEDGRDMAVCFELVVNFGENLKAARSAAPERSCG
jgi:hypothetical protein